MPLADEPNRGRKPARVKRGPEILAAILMGAGIDEIVATEGISTKRVEKMLCDELQRRWVAPARDYARLQIARLEAMSSKLSAKAEKGDLPAIDRLLRILDRLDRYHGFTVMTPGMSDYDDDARERLLAKLDKAAARLLPAQQAEP